MDAERLKAAFEVLNAQRDRRIDERVAKGEAVRVPLSLVVHDPGQVAAEVESAKADKIAELRSAGEAREVVWDEPMVIITGVPRSSDFGKDWAPLPPAKPYDRYAVASDEPRKPAIVRPSEEPAEPLVAHRIQVQVAPPTEDSPGEVVEGTYTLAEDGVLRVYDGDRNLLGTDHLPPGGRRRRGRAASVAREEGPRAVLETDPLHHALKMPHKTLERRRAYQREYQAKRRRERGMMANDDPASIKAQRPWEAYQISRALWFLRHRWTPVERERWRHREQAR
jgi:hypothetical protein